MADSGYTYLITVNSNGSVVLPALQQQARATDRALSSLGLHARDGFLLFGREAARANSMLTMLKRTALTFGAGFGIAAMGKSIVQTGVQFEKEMSSVGAISNATADELTLLTQAARQAGATTVFSARQSAQAMSYLAQAGFGASQQVSALKGTLDMAAAASMDLAQAADVTVSILSQYQMQAGQAGTVSDQLAYTANAFNTNVSEVAEAMKYMGPTAHAFGISLAETNAVIGLLSNGGLKGSMATRALGTSISRLAAPTAVMREAMKELGLQVFDANGSFVGMAGMLRQVETAFEGMTDQQKQGYLTRLFSGESIQEFNVLLAAGSEAVEEWTGKIAGSAGEAARVAEEKLDNLAGDAKKFTSMLEEQQLSLYDRMQPALRSLVQDATAFIGAMDTTALANSLGGLAQGLASVGMSLARATGFVVKHWRAFLNVAKVYATLRIAMLAYNQGTRAAIVLQNAYTAAMSMFGRAARTATTATTALNTATKLSPWGALAGLIAGAVSAMLMFRDSTNEATAAQQKLNEARFEAEQARKQSQGLREATDADALALQSGTLNDAQKQMISQNAQMRIAELEKTQAEYIAYTKKAQEKALEVEVAQEAFLAKRNAAKKEEAARRSDIFGLRKDKVILPYDAEQKKYNALVAELSALQWKRPFKDGEIAELIAKNRGLLLPDDKAVLPVMAGTAEDSRTGSDMAGNISRGGASQKIINIRIGKFQDEVNISVLPGDRAGEAIGRRLQDAVNEQLIRIINSANTMAG